MTKSPNSLPAAVPKTPVKRARVAKSTVTHRELVSVPEPDRVAGMLPPPNTAGPPRVLAIDPALRNTGWAIVERQGRKNVALAWGVIRNPPKLLPSSCLAEIAGSFRGLIEQYRPNVCGIEATIYVQNFQTAITLGAARGAALVAAAEAGLEIYEYPPRRVKQAVVGRGNADKTQVAFMVRALLGLAETPPHDAADALAIGITHLEGSDPRGGGLAKEKMRC
ncbi:MAG: crossover junction endodeoxyribonuclease RuvC [Verrucomicrobiota bacterium]